MGFRINTNIAGVNAHVYGVMNNRSLHESLAKLSSGLRINKAADDASGMAIADSLRSQTSALGQAIRNANDAIGMIQTADRAMEEQITILDVVKQKAIQSAQDGQTSKSRKALQEDISRLLEELDNIANTTSFNGQEMLSGSFVNKEFQIGAFSNTTIRASIGDTNSQKIGHVRYETNSITTDSMLPVSGGVTNLKNVTLNFLQVDGANNKQIETVAISTSAGTGLGELARVINKNKDQLNVKASANVIAHGLLPVAPGDIGNLVVNGVIIGNITGIKRNDSDGRLVNAINDVKLQTGIEASVDIQGRLQLTSIDGRAISINTDSGAYLLNGYSSQAQMTAAMPVAGRSDLYGTSVHGHHAFIGRLTFIRLGGRDVVVSGLNVSAIGMLSSQGVAETTVNLAAVKGIFNANVASAAGANANMATQSVHADGIGTGVTSYWGAQIVLDLADSALTFLDTIRADLGSSQIQLTHTINNISITQVNVKAAESQIRDVDFAEESRNFSKHNILAQSGSFAMAQANQIQSNVMRLLQ